MSAECSHLARITQQDPGIDLDDQRRRYFGTFDLEAVTPDALTAAIEEMRVDLGLERDRPRRFALWSLLYMLGASPVLPRSPLTGSGEPWPMSPASPFP